MKEIRFTMSFCLYILMMLRYIEAGYCGISDDWVLSFSIGDKFRNQKRQIKKRKHKNNIWFLCKNNLDSLSFCRDYFLVSRSHNRICQ